MFLKDQARAPLERSPSIFTRAGESEIILMRTFKSSARDETAQSITNRIVVKARRKRCALRRLACNSSLFLFCLKCSRKGIIRVLIKEKQNDGQRLFMHRVDTTARGAYIFHLNRTVA